MATPVITNIDNKKHTYTADGVNYGLNTNTNRFEATQNVSQPAQVEQPAFDPAQTENTPGLNTYKGTATQTDTTPVIQNPTLPVGETISNAYGEYLSDPNAYMAKGGESEQDFKNKTLANLQAEIDLTNTYYANKLNQARMAGQGRLGSSTAIQARRGLLGSDFGEAITRGTENVNQEIYNEIEAEKASKLMAIRTGAEALAKKNFDEAKKAKEEGFKNYIEYLKGGEEKKKTNAKELAALLVAQGVDPGTYADLETEAKKLGTTGEAVKNAYMLSRYETTKEEKKRQQELTDKIAAKGIETISEGQAGYRLNPKTGQYELVASRAKTYAPSRTSSGVGIDSNGNEIQISEQAQNIVDLINKNGGGIAQVNDFIKGSSREAQALRNEVYAGIKAQGGRTTGDTSAIMNNLNLVNKILENPGVISGPVQTGSIPFTAGATIRNQYNQLKGILALDNRQKLKGSGAISDFESRTLERAASSLGRNQSEAEFTKNLKDVRGVFQTAAGMKANVKVTTPNGQVDIGELSRDEINSAIEQGYTVEYQ